LHIFKNLKEMYIRYMDSPFAIGHPSLASERRSMLNQEGVIHQLPYIEAMPYFVSSNRTVAEVSSELSISDDFPSFSANGLFPPNLYLHEHQYDSLKAALINHGNVVITSGTGSGKTESFLLPLIASILQESGSWNAPHPKSVPWWQDGTPWKPQRANETRTAAVRGLILYPLNALVEDQLTRLRRALDSDRTRDWMDKHRKGNRIYFGRYNGQTPVAGKRPKKMNKLRSSMQKLKDTEIRLRNGFLHLTTTLHSVAGMSVTDNDFIQSVNTELGVHTISYGQILTASEIDAICQRLESQLEDKLAFISQPDQSEMVSRWDMQETPPDILITNFSMLNIALSRRIEEKMFESTKQWLRADSSNTFFLILDELHAYRGTSGTEVSYVIKSLIHRLGLTPDSPQLRIIATSASLDESGQNFLGEFFGTEYKKFKIISGERQNEHLFMANNTFKKQRTSFEQFYEKVRADESDTSAVHTLCDSLGVSWDGDAYESLYLALNQSGAIHQFIKNCKRPRSIRDLGNLLFDEQNSFCAIGGLLLALAKARRDGQVVVPLRGHLFFRNFQGLWACSNSQCTEVEPTYRYDGRTVGKLYTQPQIGCPCGGRVLDFYYCQNCGDVFLGGYKTEDNTVSDRWILSPDFPDLEKLPDKLPTNKRYGNYALYWPSFDIKQDAAAPWHAQHGQFTFQWKKAIFSPQIASLKVDALNDPTGHWFVIDGAESDEIPAFPIKCPSCGDDWEGSTSKSIYSTARVRSPIRGQRTGFDKITQVMIDTLMREFSAEKHPKMVLFSDSRQDSAKLSVKIEQGHYLDLLRRVVSSSIYENKQPLRNWIKCVQGHELSEQETSSAQHYRLEERHNARDIEDFYQNQLLQEDRLKVEELIQKASYPPSLQELLEVIERRILRQGMNPGGPYKSLQSYKSGDIEHSWTELFTFNQSKIEAVLSMPQDAERHYRKIVSALRSRVVGDTLFSQRKRDFESLALGTMITDPDIHLDEKLGKPLSFWRQLFDSSIRILGADRRYEDREGWKTPQDATPDVLRRYWKAVAERNELPVDQVRLHMQDIFRQTVGVRQYMIQPEQIHIVPFNDSIPVYSCVKCHRVHLHPSCNVCTDCYSELAMKPLDLSELNDYYRFLAGDSKTEVRVHSEELSGQTDNQDASKRQKLFQGIFDETDIPLVDEIDILSVTTTMEAGVDIGSLNVVAMSNMPPQRFNYQQRVGRAGRRGVPLSVSLTMCRGRSHDDWYFDNLDRITGDAPPQPYIDLKSEKIFKRVLVKEVLFWAFGTIGLDLGGSSIHGDFGNREDWEKYEPQVRTHLSSISGAQKTSEIIGALSCRSELTEQELQALSAYVTKGDLLQEITEIGQDPRYSHVTDLSECLATAGLLPMFGFPTRSRLLHHKERRAGMSSEQLDKGTVDRDLEIAISEYAPGAEVVKEKAKHKVVGVAHYVPRGWGIRVEENPLGRIRMIALCKQCQVLFDNESNLPNHCPSCGTGKGDVFRHIPISEPMGFRSNWDERDFTEEFEWVSRGSAPRLAQSQTASIQHVYNTAFFCQEGDIYTLNDNDGKDFTFTKARDSYEGWIETECHGVDGFSPQLTNTSVQTSLASIKNTEVLVLSAVFTAPGISFNTGSLGVRAALYSLGFLLRRVASDVLDIDADELQVGIRTIGSPGTGQIFLADRLINGAGYSRYLARPEVLKTILSDILGELNGAPTLRDHDCDSSCYECLRTYENMQFHGLLDWRLAIDVARILVDPDYVPGVGGTWEKLVKRSLGSLTSSYAGAEQIWLSGVPAMVLPGARHVILFGHPLWTKHEDYLNEQMSSATVQAQLTYPNAKLYRYDIFDLIRRPVWVVNHMLRQV